MTKPRKALRAKFRFPGVTQWQSEIFPVSAAFHVALERLAPIIRGAARTIAAGDVDLAEDMEQEAAAELVDLDPSRFDEADERYLRKALYSRMRKVLRRERRQAGETRRVDGYLEKPPVDEPVVVDVQTLFVSDMPLQ